VLLVVHDDAALSAWQRDLGAMAHLAGRDPRGIVAMPALVCDPYNDIPPHPEVERERVRALGRLARGDLESSSFPRPRFSLFSRRPPSLPPPPG
jgi:hypothetical protein